MQTELDSPAGVTQEQRRKSLPVLTGRYRVILHIAIALWIGGPFWRVHLGVTTTYHLRSLAILQYGLYATMSIFSAMPHIADITC